MFRVNNKNISVFIVNVEHVIDDWVLQSQNRRITNNEFYFEHFPGTFSRFSEYLKSKLPLFERFEKFEE